MDSFGGTVSSIYNNDNLLQTRELSGSGIPNLRIDLGYTQDLQLGGFTRYSDLAGTQHVGSSQYTYDIANRLTHLTHYNGSNVVLADYGYGPDAGGRLQSETDNGQAITYGYDSTNQLRSVSGALNASYSYDLAGNRNMAGYGPPTDNRIFTDGTWNYGYDAEGNMISAIRISNGDNWAFGYDNANEMTSVVHKDGSGNVLMTAALRTLSIRRG